MVARKANQCHVRLPDGLRERIKAAAAACRRSLNSEIIFHLERAFPAPKEAAGDEFGHQAPAVSASHAAVSAAGSSTNGL